MATSTPRIPSSSLAPTSPRSLHHLPPELLKHVVLYLAPIVFRSRHEAYQKRQSTLRSLCLVSKRILAVAQPALYSVISIQTKDQANKVLQRPDLLVHCRLLELHFSQNGSYRSKCSVETVERIAKHTSHLEYLKCGQEFAFAEPFFQKNVKNVSLKDLAFPSTSVFSAPHVEQLVLDGIEFPDNEDGDEEEEEEADNDKDEMAKYHLPALRHLAVVGGDEDMLDDQGVDSFLRNLAPRLTSMTALVVATSEDQAPLWDRPTLTFQQTCMSDVVDSVEERKSFTKHLQLNFECYFGTDAPGGKETLQDWTSLIESVGPDFPLESITLKPLESQSLNPLQKRFFQVCEERNVKVTFDVIEDYFPYEAFISPAFIERAEERRRRVEEGEKEN